MVNITACPICKSTNFIHHLNIRDHFLSQESFDVVKCTSCGFVLTNPRPADDELMKYYASDDYLSHSKKKNGIVSRIYNLVKNYSLGKKYQLIMKNTSGKRLLDIGCATGEFLNYFQKKGWETLGIEPAENPRRYAINTYRLDVYPEKKLDELHGQSFDVITMWHVLEHVPDLNMRIKQIYRLLKDDGLLVIALPNYLAEDAVKYGAFWAGYDVPRHLYHFTADTISKLLSNHSFKITEIHPLKFDSYYVSLLSEKYKKGETNFVTAFLSGLQSNLQAKKKEGNYSSLIYMAKKQSG